MQGIRRRWPGWKDEDFPIRHTGRGDIMTLYYGGNCQGADKRIKGVPLSLGGQSLPRTMVDFSRQHKDKPDGIDSFESNIWSEPMESSQEEQGTFRGSSEGPLCEL